MRLLTRSLDSTLNLIAQVGHEDEEEALTLQSLQHQLRAEAEARLAAEDEAWLLEQQLLTWQQAASTAQAQLQAAQACR